eukprot:151135_1
MDPIALPPPKHCKKRKKRIKSSEKPKKQASLSNSHVDVLSIFDDHPFQSQQPQKVANTFDQKPKANVSDNPFVDDFLFGIGGLSEFPASIPNPPIQVLKNDNIDDEEGEQNEQSSTETDESDSTDTESDKNDALARKYVNKKVQMIEAKIKKYENKLKLLQEKRVLYLTQLDPNYVAEQPQNAVRYETVDAIGFMKKGSSMLKYGKRGYPHFRHFELSHDGQYLMWYTSSKKLDKSRINLHDVTCIQKGQLTANFKKHLQPRLAPCSFSLIYQGEKTLDVITKSKNHYLLWTAGLEKIIDYNKAVKNRVYYGNDNGDSIDFPKELMVKIVKRNDKVIEKRLQMQPEPPRKAVEKELDAAIKRFSRLSMVCNDGKYANISEMDHVKKRLVELEQDVENIKNSYHTKSLNIASHEIWRTAVELKALDGKIAAISKSYRM